MNETHKPGSDAGANGGVEGMDGTFIREPDGAQLVRFSPFVWNDPSVALRERPGEWRVVPLDMVPPQVESLRPGEWDVVDEFGR